MSKNEASKNARAAAKTLSALVGSNPAEIPPRMQLARLLIELKKVKEAEVQLREVVRLQPWNLAALTLLARLCHSAPRHGERTDLLYRAAKHELCGEPLVSDALESLVAAGRWEEVIELTRAFGPKPSVDVLCARARAYCAVNQCDDAVSALRLCVVRGFEDLRDVVSRLIASGSPLIAARLVKSLGENEDVVLAHHLTEAKRAVKVHCRNEISDTQATDDPERFTELAAALLVLKPDNESLQKAVTRGCTLLLRRAREARAAGDAERSLALARQVTHVRSKGSAFRQETAKFLARSGNTREALDVLLSSSPDEADLRLAASLMPANRDWSGLYEVLQSVQWPVDSGPQLDAAAQAIRLQVRGLIERGHNLSCEVIRDLLEATLALVAIGRPAACNTMISEVINRSRRAVCGAHQGNRPLLADVCQLHLTLAPYDRAVARRFVFLLQSFGRQQDVYDELHRQLKVDPHDEGFWSRLAASCSRLGLMQEASAARRRPQLMNDSSLFELQ